jgi:hypothetical protein
MGDDLSRLWTPSHEAQLREAVQQGVIREDHHHDFKAMLAQGPAGNRDLAIDMASFAVDGGLLLIGVENGPPPYLAPVPLAGLLERIDQVAGSRIDPPLRVTARPIHSEADPDQGYMLVSVPASPAAPHQVDSVYRGRSDTTNVKLSDGELRRIRDERRRAEADAYDLLAAAIERDPEMGLDSGHAHLFVVVQPTYANPEMLLHALGDSPPQALWNMVRNSPILTQDYSPDFRQVHTAQRRADGWAVVHASTTDPQSGVSRDDALDIYFREDGGLRVFCGRAGDIVPAWQTRVVMPSIIGGLVWRTLDLARSIAGLTGYVGNWQVAVGITRLRGAVGLQDGALLQTPYSEDDYRSAFAITTADLEAGPDAIVDRLLGRLGRALAGDNIQFPHRK